MSNTALETQSLFERLMGPIAMVGGLVVAIGVALIAQDYWSAWSSPVRIFATLGVSLIFLALSVVPSIAQKASVSGALAAIGSPLLPFGAFVLLDELGFKSHDMGAYWVLFLSGLSLSLLSFWQKRGTYAFFGFPLMLAGAVSLARFYLFGDHGFGWWIDNDRVPTWYGDVESSVVGLLLLLGACWAVQNAKRLLAELWSFAGIYLTLYVPFHRWFEASWRYPSEEYLWLMLCIVTNILMFVVAGKLRSWLGLFATAIATVVIAVSIGYQYFSDNVGIAVVVAGVLIILFGSGAVFTWRHWFKRQP